MFVLHKKTVIWTT